MRDKIITQLEDMLKDSDVTTSEVGEQRERNYRYYTMQPLGNERRGRSHYIDPTVLSSVESKKAIFSETFLSSRQVVTFSEGRGADGEAKAKTAYVNKVFKKNQYERLFRDAWHDAFVAKRCVIWVSWEKETETQQIRVQGAPGPVLMEQIQGLGNVVGIDDSQLEGFPIPSIGPQQFVYTGVVNVEVDASFVKLDLIAPEKFYRDPNATYPDESQFCAQEIEIARGALLEMGYDEKVVERLTKDYTYSGTEEDFARKAHDQSYTGNYQKTATHEGDLVTIYKTRAWMMLEEGDVENFDPEPGLALYEVTWAKGQILQFAGDDGETVPDIRVVDDMSIYEWQEYKVSHAEMGMCTADIEAMGQKTTSIIKRGILDNLQMVNNTRYEAVHDRLLNPRDLLDNIIGGTVFTDQIGSVAPLAQPPLSPMTLPTLEMLQRDSEERSGMSSLAKGMNSAAINNQNADNMIERLTTAGQRRVTAECRDFARTFLVPLMQCIVKYGMKYDQTQDQMESGGKVIPIIPSQWSEDILDMDIAVALTPDEAQSMAQKMIMLHQLKDQDEQVGPMYGPEQRHAFYDTVYELIGVEDATPYLLPPQSPQYQQAMQQKQQQAQQAEQVAMMQAQQQAALIETQTESLSQQIQQGWAALNNKILDTAHDNSLDDEKFDHTVFKDNAELALEAEQDRAVSVG